MTLWILIGWLIVECSNVLPTNFNLLIDNFVHHQSLCMYINLLAIVLSLGILNKVTWLHNSEYKTLIKCRNAKKDAKTFQQFFLYLSFPSQLKACEPFLWIVDNARIRKIRHKFNANVRIVDFLATVVIFFSIVSQNLAGAYFVIYL